MAKDKAKEILYKQEGLRRAHIRFQKRKEKTNKSYKYTHDEYSCPRCGLNSLHCSNRDYGYDCPKCKIHFETPDT